MEEIHINTSNLKSDKEYVCWIDTMGTKNTMSESFEKAANFMIRFHAIVMESIKGVADVKCYPLMDGIYLTSTKWNTLKRVINKIYSEAAGIFIKEEVIAHRFLIRGAIAFGQIAHGTAIADDVCQNFHNMDNYKSTLLMGMPMIQSYTAESSAPPFGMYIHESARQPKILQGRFYAWSNDEKLKALLRQKIHQYFDWCSAYRNYLQISSEKIVKYKQLNDEYFLHMLCKEQEYENRNK